MPLSAGSNCDTIAASKAATLVRELTWAYPALETLRIIGIALVFGSILAYDLRVLGLHKVLPLRLLGQHLLPWVWTGFAINATSGTLLFASDATEFAANPALQAKLGLLILAGLNALLFQTRPTRTSETWDQNVTAPWTARMSAAASIALWLGIITAGRIIAYIK